MKIQELAKRIEGKHILKMNNDNALNSREDLYSLLKLWKELTKGDTIGDIANDRINNNTKIVRLELKNSSFYINADTTREGVLEFLENQENDWNVIMSNRGNLNKITNNEDESPIDGFYMYQVIN